MAADPASVSPVIGLQSPVSGLISSFLSTTQAFIQLTKPRIVLVFGITGLAALVMAMAKGHASMDGIRVLAVLAGTILTAASANALNQYFDRDIDAVMERTRKKRPLPAGRISPGSALAFGLVTGVFATWLLVAYGSPLAAAFGAFTILFYVGVYTLWLKRLTPYNIVIGGAAGATAPLICWAAATGSLALAPVLMFLVVFLWTPPHFWALALCIRDEYAQVSVPMLPVAKGVAETRRQILRYSLALVPLTLALVPLGACGRLYLAAAVLLGWGFLLRAWKVYREAQEDQVRRPAWKLFGYSILYLILLFAAMIGDASAHEQVPLELQGVGIEEKLGAQVDLNLTFRDEEGKQVPLRTVFDGRHPVLLFLAYYECPNLCNFFLNGATEALKKLEWTTGKEFRVLTVSIDPRETPELARGKKQAHLEAYGRPEGAAGWRFWVSERDAGAGDETNARRLASQVGFGYRYDKERDQYAHAAGMVVLTPEGKVSRYLHGIEFAPKDLKLALVEAGGRKIGSVVDHLLLFCYNYDPKTRKYSLYATNIMRAGGALTVVILGAVLSGYWLRNRRRGSPS